MVLLVTDDTLLDYAGVKGGGQTVEIQSPFTFHPSDLIAGEFTT
jgi:hypothetical protein